MGPIRLIRQLERLVQELEALQELQGQLEESQSEECPEVKEADLEGILFSLKGTANADYNEDRQRKINVDTLKLKIFFNHQLLNCSSSKNKSNPKRTFEGFQNPFPELIKKNASVMRL